jgi:glycerol-3-phosphate dehydrogenase
VDEAPVDLLVVGGGINGAGIARDAAGRGWSVVLCEQGDLAGATSSASTKLIHGGLRYLETFQFRLVREALVERDVLLRAAPHIVRPLRFVLPHNEMLRPAWMIRLGLFLYDHLAGRGLLPGSRGVDLRRDPAGQPLDPRLRRGFDYYDCWVEDARLVVLNARDAAERGATILPRTECTAARRADGLWHATLRPASGGAERVVRARALVNAAGPWVESVLARLGGKARGHVRLVKGSHIVVPQLYEGDHAYILQNDDRRVVFAIPYEGRFTLIGTTEVDHASDAGAPVIDPAEVAYLCAAVGRYLTRKVAPADVVWSYSGVRPLYDDAAADPSSVTRDYVLELDAADGAAPLLSVFGGKITTFRRLAEHALDKLGPLLGGARPAWTAAAPLPGGDIPGGDMSVLIDAIQRKWSWLPAPIARRYARAYGTRVERILGNGAEMADLGRPLGDGVYEAELNYLVEAEWAETAEDVLWRRSKLGLHVTPATAAAIDEWMRARTAGEHPAVAIPAWIRPAPPPRY